MIHAWSREYDPHARRRSPPTIAALSCVSGSRAERIRQDPARGDPAGRAPVSAPHGPDNHRATSSYFLVVFGERSVGTIFVSQYRKKPAGFGMSEVTGYGLLPSLLPRLT
jgi:hypothetical protein